MGIGEYILLGVTIVIVIFSFTFTFFKSKGAMMNKKALTEETIGILKKIERTGLYINEQPQLRLTFDAVLESGFTEVVEVKEIISLTQIHLLSIGGVFPIRYDPIKKVGIIDEDNIDKEKLQDKLDLYMSRINLKGPSYLERLNFRKYGVTRLAIISDLKIGEKQDNNIYEIVVTIRLDESDGNQRFLTKTCYINEHELDNIAIGKIVEISLLDGPSPVFSINTKADKIFIN